MKTVYVLVMVWVLPHGDYIEWKGATYDKPYHCLTHLNKLQKYVDILPVDWIHLRCKKLTLKELVE